MTQTTIHEGRMLTPPSTIHWHRPLLWLAGAMALLAAFALLARFTDGREITGLNAWDKPLKFALSTLIYSVTWSWLIGQLQRGRKTASVVGTSIAVLLAVELVVITGAAAAGVTSHFNLTMPLTTAMWSIMGVSIVGVWIATFVAAVVLFRNPLGDRARTVAIRNGAVISLIGLGLGFLMTSPTAAQLNDFQGVAGAHTVGIADGGPGLPILGWGTVAGDLRIPHFVGMHALQAIPLALIALEILSRRIAALRDVKVRARLIWIASAGYLAFTALFTWQALRGQSIVLPDAATLGIGVAILAAMLVGTAFTFRPAFDALERQS
ncbi:hypothetical protein [Arthrobacter sp. H5]|uniref:hypothetical protein n=1 Tax=Arthrobacter sp. H5 TaxID=1267973 RepID=UPI0004BBC86D|nr:hypothetical protein [Arthrobacter sp. H5]